MAKELDGEEYPTFTTPPGFEDREWQPNLLECAAVVMALFALCSSPAVLTSWWPMPVGFATLSVLCFTHGRAQKRGGPRE